MSWHLSFADAKDTLEVPVNKQYVVASAASENGCPRCDEITAFRLDTTLDVLVIAPTMTDYHKTGGSGDMLPGYSKMPKGNVDITGKYFIWSSNIGSNRLDVFITKIPSQLLVPDSVLTSVVPLEEKNDMVKIFPNPANDNLTIETSQKSYIEILSIEGQLIQTLPPCREAGATTGNKTNINVSVFPSGVYIVEVKTEKGIEVRKFVKE